ncbi:MAG: tetratricopeptide repeat protein [Bacteroidales bacterium]|nr:tetratricopeptide repeat protein [Bacteroidales bacterium]
MPIWTTEIREIEKLAESLKDQFPDLGKELEQLLETGDANVVMLYSRRCLEVIVSDLCECELKRPRKTEPLKGIIDKLGKEEKVPQHIITSMDHLNSLSAYGTHPRDFDPEQVKPVLVNLAVVLRWYIKYKTQVPAEPATGNAGISTTRRILRKLRMRFVLPAGLILVLVLFYLFSSGSTLPFSERDRILITDFENQTENPVFDRSLYTAFTLSTSQSRYINVFPRSRMLELLGMMEMKDLEFIDEKTGKEMATREGINLYIVPSISEIGNRYALAVKILETKSGNLLRSVILYAETQEQILPALDQLSKKIRRDLGESRYNISGQDKPLVPATTSSLEALKLYSEGTDKLTMTDFKSAKDYFERALQVDSGFIAAKASLGIVNIEKFDPVVGRKQLSQAARKTDNLTERERLSILAFHATWVENDLPKAIEYVKTRIDLYPDDPAAHNNLGWFYWNTGDLGKAAEAYKEAIRCDRHLVLPYGSLLWMYLEYIGNADSALVWAQKMVADNPQSPWSYANLGSAWLCLGDLSKAEEAYSRAHDIDPALIANLYNLANVYRLLKHYNKAIETLKHILEINQSELLAYYTLGVNYQYIENPGEATKYFNDCKVKTTERLSKQANVTVGDYIDLACVSARLGDMDSSGRMFKKALETDSTAHINLARVYCLHGKTPETLDQLELAFKSGYRNLYWLKTFPDVDVLQYDTRFLNLLDKYFR